MTNEEIDALEAGQELDAIAYRVIPVAGVGIWHPNIPYPLWTQSIKDGAFCPSSNMDDAWEVIEELKRRNFDAELLVMPGRLHYCRFSVHDRVAQPFSAYAPTMPLAICRAALKATTGAY